MNNANDQNCSSFIFNQKKQLVSKDLEEQTSNARNAKDEAALDNSLLKIVLKCFDHLCSASSQSIIEPQEETDPHEET
jgi:hypothetical protein